MECKSYKFKETAIDLVLIGDIHIGDKAFTDESLKKLKGYIDYIKTHSNAYCFLMGDIINCATMDSKSSPFAQNMTVDEQIKMAVKLFEPIKKKCLGGISGNHELRLERYCGYSPMITICDRLGIPYMGNLAIVIFRMCCHGPRDVSRTSFTGCFSHTTGGGNTTGGKINRPEELKKIVGNCDFYAGAHNHSLITSHGIVFKVNETTEKIEQLRQIVVTTGGYLQFDGSYVEEKMLKPLKIGSPKISLITKQHNHNECHKDIHVSL
jgi:hypothetical protein